MGIKPESNRNSLAFTFETKYIRVTLFCYADLFVARKGIYPKINELTKTKAEKYFAKIAMIKNYLCVQIIAIANASEYSSACGWSIIYG